MWRCKACGMVVTPVDVEDHGGFCKECRNEQFDYFVFDGGRIYRRFLAWRKYIQGAVEEELMRKKHAPSEVHHMTLCGHEATPQEFRKMQERDLKFVNCKHCLGLLK